MTEDEFKELLAFKKLSGEIYKCRVWSQTKIKNDSIILMLEDTKFAPNPSNFAQAISKDETLYNLFIEKPANKVFIYSTREKLYLINWDTIYDLVYLSFQETMDLLNVLDWLGAKEIKKC